MRKRCEACGQLCDRLAQNNRGEWVCTTRCILKDPTLTREQRRHYQSLANQHASSERKGAASHVGQ